MPISIVPHGLTKITAVRGRGAELNCGGMTVYAGVELSVGDQVAIEFTPPYPYSGQPIKVRCFVRDGHGGRYGLEFITENDADYDGIGQLESILRIIGSSGPPQ